MRVAPAILVVCLSGLLAWGAAVGMVLCASWQRVPSPQQLRWRGDGAPWTRAADVPATVLAALVAAIDRDFATRPGLAGVFALRLLRATHHQLIPSATNARVCSTSVPEAIAADVLTCTERARCHLDRTMLALRLELELERNEQLELLLNHIRIGAEPGVAPAARKWLSTPVEALSLDEAIALASLWGAPARIAASPTLQHNRHVMILDAMLDAGFDMPDGRSTPMTLAPQCHDVEHEVE